ncbi:MAG: hypothetical protein A4E57_04681 [Syntrophorhabdaceae bacterium PtaU1.Bin034]|nr:MAG: hypothetical protein A4E57_04681 [Syntrophorhabdaceae bacterium PtaU1.Bin034]
MEADTADPCSKQTFTYIALAHHYVSSAVHQIGVAQSKQADELLGADTTQKGIEYFVGQGGPIRRKKCFCPPFPPGKRQGLAVGPAYDRLNPQLPAFVEEIVRCALGNPVEESSDPAQ